MTDAELDRINAERRRNGLPPLTRSQATNAVISSPRRNDDSFNSTDFLIGHHMLYPSSPSAPEPSPRCTAPEPSASHDSGSSYDSGGSSGGSDGGGGE